MRKKYIFMVLVLFIIIVLFLSACTTKKAGTSLESVTGNVVQDTNNLVKDEKSAEDRILHSDSTDTQIKTPRENVVEQVVYEPIMIKSADSCSSKSCPNGICYEGVCKIPKCISDDDCKDNDSCTIDKCNFAGHPNAFCSDEIITRDRNGDGCCPAGSYMDKDTDCEAICGNNKCEFGETTDTCYVDCKNAGTKTTIVYEVKDIA